MPTKEEQVTKVQHQLADTQARLAANKAKPYKSNNDRSIMQALEVQIGLLLMQLQDLGVDVK